VRGETQLNLVVSGDFSGRGWPGSEL